jgi:hypothetical protein
MAYAEGSHIHLCFSWGLGFNFYIETGFLWPTTEAIDEAFYIVFSNNDVDWLPEMTQGFYQQYSGAIACFLFSDDDFFSLNSPFSLIALGPSVIGSLFLALWHFSSSDLKFSLF